MKSLMRVRSIVRLMVASLVFLSIMLFTGCRDERNAEALAGPSMVPTAHPPGTLLRTAQGALWMVEEWPNRSLVTPDEARNRHFEAGEATLMSWSEELCLRNSGRLWRGLEGWRLVRLSDGSMWYVNETRHDRRAARPEIMQAWRDTVGTAQMWVGVPQTFMQRYSDLGPMVLPDGALVRTDGKIFYVWNGDAHPFASELLAAEAGYDLNRAVVLPDGDLGQFAEMGSTLTAELFTSCPLRLLSPSPDMVATESIVDADGDGVSSTYDCDDTDANRAPGLTEICDGVDNDCNTLVDEPFPVNEPCTLDDGCQSPGTTQCNFDMWSVSCQNEDAICE